MLILFASYCRCSDDGDQSFVEQQEIGFNHSDHNTNLFNRTPPIFGFNMFDDLHLAVLVGPTFFRSNVWQELVRLNLEGFWELVLLLYTVCIIRFRYSIVRIGRVVIEVGGMEIGVQVGFVGRSLLHNNSTPGVLVRNRSGVVLVVCLVVSVFWISLSGTKTRINDRNCSV